MRCDRRTYLEEGLEALLCGLLLEAFLLFGTEGTGLFGLLYLVEHGLELNCRSYSRYTKQRQLQKPGHREAIPATHVSENT